MIQSNKNKNQIDVPVLKKEVILRIILLPIVLGVLLFISAGTIYYWEAWVYIIVLFVPMIIFMIYLLKKDPALLERRMEAKEKESEQKWIVLFSSLLIVSIYIISGFGKRFGWSQPPVLLILVSDIIVLSGYLFFCVVLLENRYASRTVEVEKNHKLITTGPYKIIRHPMYLAVFIIFLSTPFALGSYYSAPGNVFIIFLLIARIRNEEKVLIKHLTGYKEYIKKVKYRLIPGIW